MSYMCGSEHLSEQEAVLVNKRPSYCLLLEATQLQNNAELLDL